MTSKKLIEVFDHLAVNFMVGCTLLILSIKNVNLFLHKRNMSSIYLHRKYGLYSDSFIISSSSSAIDAIERCKFDTNSSHPSFLKHLLPNLNMLNFNTTSAKSIMVSVETYFSLQLSNRFLNADRPSSCGMFAYNPITFIIYVTFYEY